MHLENVKAVSHLLWNKRISTKLATTLVSVACLVAFITGYKAFHSVVRAGSPSESAPLVMVDSFVSTQMALDELNYKLKESVLELETRIDQLNFQLTEEHKRVLEAERDIWILKLREASHASKASRGQAMLMKHH